LWRMSLKTQIAAATLSGSPKPNVRRIAAIAYMGYGISQ
jgi:hypothetical protein